VQAFQPFVPSATMQIAREVEARTAQPVVYSEVVRVGISNTGFSTYDYSEIKIFGTDDIEIYNDENSCPRVRLLKSNINCKINLSISHEKEKAIAFAMLNLEDFEKTTYHPCYMGDEG
jgi:hypothetical protein